MDSQLITEAKSLCKHLQRNNYEVLVLGAHKLDASKSFLEGTQMGRKFVESSVSLLNKFTSFCYEGTSTTTEHRPASQTSKGNLVYGNIRIKQEVEDDYEPPPDVPEPPAVFGRHGRKIKAPKWKEDYYSPKTTKRAQNTEEESVPSRKRMKVNNSDPKKQSQTKESSKTSKKLGFQGNDQTKSKLPVSMEKKLKVKCVVTEKKKENTKQVSESTKLYMDYSCSVCNQIFESQDDVDEHEKTHEVKTSCQLCPEVLQSVEDLFFHLHKQHSDNFCFWCNIFKVSTTEMKMHKANCPTEGDFKRKCHFCIKVWHSSNEFEDHVINWHGPKDQKCSQCDRSFSSPLALHDHEKEHKLTEENYCVECKKGFSSSQDFIDHVLKNHISVSSDASNNANPGVIEGFSADKNIAETQGNSRIKNVETFEVNTSDLPEEIDTENEKDLQSDEDYDDEDYVGDDGDEDDDEDYEQDMQSTTFPSSEKQSGVYVKKKKKESSKLTKKSRKGSFPCTVCNKTFNRFYLMKRHKKNHVKVDLNIECRLCKETFNSKYLELKHLLANHKENFCLWCDETFKDESEKKAHDSVCPPADEKAKKRCHVCPKQLANKLNFETHFSAIHNGDFKCHTCGHVSVSKYMFERHMRFHGPGEKMECPECSKVFMRKENLDKHLRQVHKVTKPKVVKEIFPCECQVCQAGFHSRTELADHIKESHMAEIDEKIVDNPKFTINFHEGHFICKKCGKNGTNEDELAIHMASHLGILNKNNTFICDVCGEKFLKKNLFTAHRARHTNEKEFPCTKCNKKFHVRSSLISHLQTHRTYRDFVCHICGNAFKSRPSLRMHAKRHDMDRCHVCKYCNKTFRCYDGLKYHWVVYHPEEVTKRKLTVFPCSYCDKVLATKTQHARHLAKHGVEKNHRCEMCSNRYCTVAQLNAHIKNTHGQNRNIHCSACDLYFLIPSKMLRHMKSHKHNENCAKKGIHPSAFYELLAKLEKEMVESVDLQQYRAAKSSTKYRKLYKSMGGIRKDLGVETESDLMGMLQNEETVTIDLSNVQYIDNLPREVLEEVEISDQKPNTEVFVVYDQGPETSGHNPRNMSLDAQAVETLQSILNLSTQH